MFTCVARGDSMLLTSVARGDVLLLSSVARGDVLLLTSVARGDSSWGSSQVPVCVQVTECGGFLRTVALSDAARAV